MREDQQSYCKFGQAWLTQRVNENGKDSQGCVDAEVEVYISMGIRFPAFDVVGVRPDT